MVNKAYQNTRHFSYTTLCHCLQRLLKMLTNWLTNALVNDKTDLSMSLMPAHRTYKERYLVTSSSKPW